MLVGNASRSETHRSTSTPARLPITVPATTFNLQSSTYIPRECSVSLFTRLYPPIHVEPLSGCSGNERSWREREGQRVETDKEETDFSWITQVQRLDTASQEQARGCQE